MDWYYADNKKRVGPVSATEFRSLVDKGIIGGRTLVWNETLTNWIRFEDSGLPPGPDPAAIPDVEFIPDAVFIPDPGTGSVRAPEKSIPITFMQYAGFWVRLGAKLIDGIIMTVISMAFNAVITGFMIMPGHGMHPDQMEAYMAAGFFAAAIQWGINIFYVTWFLGRFGATPGKMAFGLKVVTAENEKISYLRAFARFFAEFISGIILFIGYIMAAFDAEKRTLHDRLCHTRVVKK